MWKDLAACNHGKNAKTALRGFLKPVRLYQITFVFVGIAVFLPPIMYHYYSGEKPMNYLFTSESVSEGHPDKVADQISDALLDEFLAYDPNSKVACETLVTTGQVVLAGEVKSNAYVDLMEVARRVIHRIGYNKSSYKFDADSCGIFRPYTSSRPISIGAWSAPKR